MPVPDPAAWLDRHGDYLFRFAMLRLRDETHAEDLVQETLLAALRSYESFGGRSSERTWLTGILKHKLIDHFRRSSRETPVSDLGEDGESADRFFRTSGEWTAHWEPSVAPTAWHMTPASEYETTEFWRIFDSCLGMLSERTARAFMLRELEGFDCSEICEVLNVSTSNLWVMLHRARMNLRHCIEVNWLGREAAES